MTRAEVLTLFLTCDNNLHIFAQKIARAQRDHDLAIMKIESRQLIAHCQQKAVTHLLERIRVDALVVES